MTTHTIRHGQACGKIILIGEHAVVYGAPAIAIPFQSVGATVHVRPSDDQSRLHCDFYTGSITDMPETLLGLKVAIEETLASLNQSDACLTLTIDSTIPIERGMGSSASIAIAMIRALYTYYQQELPQETLLALVNASEKVVHGNPSGIDAAIIATEHALVFQKAQPSQSLTVSLDAYLIVADSGITGRTKEAVTTVKAFQEEHPVQHAELLSQLETLVLSVQQELQDGDSTIVGQAFTHAHTCLQELGVSHPTIDMLVQTAIDHSALGAKLTGGGLGGCMIALAHDSQTAQTIANALLQNGAKQTFIQSLKK